MALTWRALVLIGALPVLNACGGGGGGAPAQSPPPPAPVPAPAPTTGPLALTEANTVDATALVMRQIEHTHVATESMIFTAEVLYSDHISQTTIACEGNVVASLSNADSDRSGNLSPGDTLRFQFTSCAGVTRDTTMVIAALDYGAGTIEGRVTFEESTDAGVRTSGTFYLDSSYDHKTLEITRRITDINVTVTTGSATATVSEAESVRYFLYDAYRITLSGRVNSAALGGELTFATPAAFTGRLGNVPTGGQLELSGGASRARITPSTDPALSADQFAYQVDATGTGTYSAVRHGHWATAVVGLIFCWDANTRPDITNLSLAPANPTVRDQLTASYAATDADGDKLFYFFDWLVNGALVAYGSTSPTLPLDRFRKGDVVTFVLRVNDSRVTSTATASMTIVNLPPENVIVTLEPTVARTTDDLVIRYEARDPDQGDYPQATFQWLRDGVVIPGETGQYLPNTQQAKGQVITAVVRVTDGEAITSASTSITIQDTPPVVQLPLEYTPVAYGQTVAFDATASDVDGDSIGRFVLSHGPAGMTVNPTTGRVSWPMRGPAFERSVVMNYAVTLDQPGANVATGVVVLDAPNRKPALFAIGTDPPVTSGLVAGDFDNDGDVELLVAGQNMLHELEWTGTGLRQSWVYSLPFNMTKPPTALATADVDGDGRHEIFVAHGSYLTKLDGVDRRPQAMAGSGVEEYPIRDIEIADVDGDGRLDVITIASLNRSADPTASARVMVFGADGMNFFNSYPIDEGSAIAVGNVDSDPQLEIVTNSGYVFDVFNWLNHWRYPTPFGWDIDVGDLDGNGIDEIVASVGDGSVRAYSGVTRTATWTVANANTDAVVIADVVGDARKEVVIGDGAGGGLVKVYAQTAPGTATLVGSVSAVGNDVPAIATGDLDDDGSVDLIWGSTTPEPSITIAAGTPLQVEWTTADLPYGALLGPFVGGELARRPVGAPTVLFATTRSAVGGARLLGMDPTTGDLTVGADLGSPGNGNVALAVSDYDNDGTDEALLASSSGGTAYHRAYDFFNGSIEWNTTFASTDNGVAVAYGDIQGNSRVDLAAIDQQGVVRAYEVGSSTPFWTSPVLGAGRDVAIAELNGGGRPEIVVAAADRIRVYSRDGSTNFVETRINASPLPDLRDIEIGDIDGDGALDIFALYGSQTNIVPTSVQRLDAALTVRGGFDYWRWSRGLGLERSSFPRKNLVFTDTIEGEQVIVVDPYSGAEIWESPALLGAIPRGGVDFVDVAGNGDLRISVATSLGMYLTR